MASQEPTSEATEPPNQPIQGPSHTATLTHLLFSKNERAAFTKARAKYTTLTKPKTTSEALQHTTTNPNPNHPPPPTLHLTTPSKPLLLALPQIAPTPTTPILRALPLPLPPHLPFLAIIDAYNLSTTPSPSLQALDAAGAILGLVPEPHVQLASHVVAAVAAVSEEELAKARGGVLLERVNGEVLVGTGWEVEVVRGKALPALMGVETLPVMPALEEDVEIADDGDGAVSTSNTVGTTNAERRVRALESAGLVAPVTFDVPPPAEQTKRMQRFLAKQQGKEVEKYREEQTVKREKRAKERREREAKRGKKVEKMRRLEEERGRLEVERREQERGQEEKEVRKVRKEYERRIERVTREAQEVRDALEKEAKRAEEKRVERERKKLEKLTWLVFRNVG